MVKADNWAERCHYCAEQTETVCEFCDKIRHTEYEYRSRKNAIAELKKENAKKSVACTTSAPAEDEEGPYEAV